MSTSRKLLRGYILVQTMVLCLAVLLFGIWTAAWETTYAATGQASPPAVTKVLQKIMEYLPDKLRTPWEQVLPWLIQLYGTVISLIRNYHYTAI